MNKPLTAFQGRTGKIVVLFLLALLALLTQLPTTQAGPLPSPGTIAAADRLPASESQLVAATLARPNQGAVSAETLPQEETGPPPASLGTPPQGKTSPPPARKGRGSQVKTAPPSAGTGAPPQVKTALPPAVPGAPPQVKTGPPPASSVAPPQVKASPSTARPGAASQEGAGQGALSPEDSFVTIDFNDVDINLFIKYISELTGKNFIVDRTVKGKVTIISPTRITAEDAYFVFESVLEVYGFTTVESGSVTKIIPSVQARSKSIQTIMEEGMNYPEDKVVTQLISLTYSDPEEVKRLIAPLVSKSSVVISHPDSGLLILTDVLSNITRLLEIIRAVDVPSVGDEMVLIPLVHASADSVAKALSQLFVKTAAKQGQRQDMVKIIPYERTNSLIVIADKGSIQKVRDLVAKIDTEAPQGTGKIQVYYLQHARADEIVKVLTNLPSDKATQGGAPAATPEAAAKAPPISKDLKIMADAETNSLIITGPRDEYMVLEEVIKKLDIPRRMVYIEALIMEVSVSKAFEIGVQWGGAGTFNDETGRLVTGFSGSATDPFGQLQGTGSLAADVPVMPAGFTVGVLQQGIKIGNVFFPNLGAVVKAYKDDSDVDIIATPQILTTDNKEAEIKVGENVPYITNKQNSAGTTDALNYQQYEYKDVATSLKILPQINQSDLVRLEIGVEVVKLKTASETPTTLKRTANTTVVLHNEETIVIGGIIGQDTSSGEYKVPLLGDIPVLGHLFKSSKNTEIKTNLFIFITPHIVENPAELASLYYQKRDVMEYVKKGSSAIPDFKFSYEPRPSHAAALADIGFSKMQEKDYGRAREYFEQALKIDKNNATALLNLGLVSEQEGNRGQAAELYQRIVDLAPPEGEGAGAAQQLNAVKETAAGHLQRLGVPPKPPVRPPADQAPPGQPPPEQSQETRGQ
ncbi:MAG: type II secretion system secretin GspD [Desulfobulbaceae bacterium]